MDQPIPFRISLTTGDNLIHFGTVLYLGLIPNSKGSSGGEWLGIEWDDSSRGKHSGTHEGISYFECRIPGAGSFLRFNTKALSYGITFNQAVRSKYLGEGSQEEVEAGGSTFYETSSNFKVEVVSLVKIKERFKDLTRSKEIGLEREGVKGVGLRGEEEDEESVVDQLVRLETLSLSFSLLPNFSAAASIIQSIPTLRNLELNSNRFEILREPTHLVGLAQLKSLHLNKTLISWLEILYLSPSLPLLEEIQLGFNQITSLSSPSSPSPPSTCFPNLHTLNLDSNRLTSLPEALLAVSDFPSLKTLILSSNLISSIPTAPAPTLSSLSTTSSILHLNLSDNLLSTWSDIDQLSNWLPHLEGVWLGLNPLFLSTGSSSIVGKGSDPEIEERVKVLARVGSLKSYEGSLMRKGEREDAESFYLSSIAKEEGSEEEKRVRHPRYLELLEKYATQSTTTTTVPVAKSKVNNLKSKLITIKIIHPFPLQLSPSSPSSASIPSTVTSSIPSSSISVLPTSSTRSLRTVIPKQLLQVRTSNGTSLSNLEFKFVALLKPNLVDEYEAGEEEEEEEEEEGVRVEIPIKEEGRELKWWGLQDMDTIQVVPL